MAERAAVLLCGGRSSRMGRAKAWLPWRGQPMLAHVVSVLQTVVSEIVVVRSAALDLPRLPKDVRIVQDEWTQAGPLAGLATGLSYIDSDLAYATSTDAPFLQPTFIHAVLARGRAAAAVVDGYVQPLAAAYPRHAAPLARELMEAGRRRPLDLLESLDFTALCAEDLPRDDSLRGFNLPAEYLDALHADGQHEAVRLEFVGRPRRLAGCTDLRVCAGTLRQVLAQAPASLALCDEDRVAAPFLVSLEGRDFVRDTRIPIGPGERVIVLDASAGG